MIAFRIPLRSGAAALVLAAAVSASSAGPGAAAPARAAITGLDGFVASGAVEPVRARRGPVRARRRRARLVPPGIAAGAAIGSAAAVGYGSGGYGDPYGGAGPYPGHNYPASNGRIYPYCVFDEGYGRVRPCDAGGGMGP